MKTDRRLHGFIIAQQIFKKKNAKNAIYISSRNNW